MAYFTCERTSRRFDIGTRSPFGVAARSGLPLGPVTTSADEHDLDQVDRLLHGGEEFISADAGYQGAQKREALARGTAD